MTNPGEILLLDTGLNMAYFDQNEFDIRCEWALEGTELLSPSSDAVMIVDVISFSTSVAVAVERGARVYPFRGSAEEAAVFAHSVDAVLANSLRRDPAGFSLAPTSMLRALPGMALVLPSPNGSTLSLAAGSTPTFAGCLRNARTVALAAAKMGRRVSVIQAGERWPDGRLRPALEDQIGAGAIIHYLPGTRSPEAQAAEAVFLHFQDDLLGALLACSSGKEAAERGSRRDVELAAELNVSEVAPRLVNGVYQNFSNGSS